MELPFDMDFLSFAKELELMEPTGYQNPRPTFLVKAQGLRFDRIGFSQHVKYVAKNIELMGFSKFAPCLAAKTGRVDFEISLGINAFQNRESAQGIIQTLQFEDVDIDDDEAIRMNLHQLDCEGSANLSQTTVEKSKNGSNSRSVRQSYASRTRNTTTFAKQAKK